MENPTKLDDLGYSYTMKCRSLVVPVAMEIQMISPFEKG
jgi:hypothetical protein